MLGSYGISVWFVWSYIFWDFGQLCVIVSGRNEKCFVRHEESMPQVKAFTSKLHVKDVLETGRQLHTEKARNIHGERAAQ